MLFVNRPLLARFGTGRLYSLPEDETGPKRRAFQRHKFGVTELLKGVSLQDFSALSTTYINDLGVVRGWRGLEGRLY
jgi:hypothetical protein